jgi:hypothetical protein
MKPRLMVFIIAAISLAGMVASANASTVFEQLPGEDSNSILISSPLNTSGETPGYQVFDNFLIAGGSIVQEVEWWGQSSLGSNAFEITFYDDVVGAPGALLSTIAVSPTITGPVDTGSVWLSYLYSASLSAPFMAAPGAPYWISIFNADTNAEWYWLSANAPGDGALQAQIGTTNWLDTPPDMSFRLLDNAPSVPEPSTWGLVGIGILALAGFRRRLS